MKYLILGKNGQLGSEFMGRLGKNAVGVGREECDISDFENVKELFYREKPDVVINCAAYNLVDKAEKDYITAYKTNALGVRNLAYLSNKINAFFVHYSTDYVFDGTKESGLYTEEDTPNPLNEYGKSKLTGERWIVEEMEKYLLFRVSWVYGRGKQNFVYKLLQWAKNNDYLKIAYDEISVPTSTRTIVEVTLKALDNGLTGLYHLTNSGYASRYEWAKKILEIKGLKKFIYPVSKDIFGLPAKRPKFSAMDSSRIDKILNLRIKQWEKELIDFLSRN